jgi:predicted metal-dependent hydrolase
MMGIDPCQQTLHPAALKGLELFNQGEFYAAHEELETAWREDSTEFRKVYQAILQVAVVFLHIQISNHIGAVQLSEKAIAKLDRWQLTCRGIDLVTFRADFITLMREVDRLGPDNIHSIDPSFFHKIHYSVE